MLFTDPRGFMDGFQGILGENTQATEATSEKGDILLVIALPH